MTNNNFIQDINRKCGVFNFGAFVFGPIFLLLNGKKREGKIWIIFNLISGVLYPIQNVIGISLLILSFIIGIYYTSSGNEILINHHKLKSKNEFLKINKKWKVSCLITLSIILFIVVTL
jgi:hypothetical protein